MNVDCLFSLLFSSEELNSKLLSSALVANVRFVRFLHAELQLQFSEHVDCFELHPQRLRQSPRHLQPLLFRLDLFILKDDFLLSASLLLPVLTSLCISIEACETPDNFLL